MQTAKPFPFLTGRAFACLNTKKPASEETGFNTTRGNQTTTMNEILKGVENISDNIV